jgi:hypothetical protein
MMNIREEIQAIDDEEGRKIDADKGDQRVDHLVQYYDVFAHAKILWHSIGSGVMSEGFGVLDTPEYEHRAQMYSTQPSAGDTVVSKEFTCKELTLLTYHEYRVSFSAESYSRRMLIDFLVI